MTAILNSPAALEIKDLVIRYGNVDAVRGVSVTAQAGQHVTFVGPSGCGKTTTLRAIAGLERPAAGRISLFGRAVFDAAAAIDVPTDRRDVSMVFQSYAIWPHMSVFENVAYGLRLRKVPKDEIRERVLKALDLVGLSALVDREAPHLSGGQQQRVALARSFVFNPKILLFDEPLSNLDAKLRSRMRIELKELASSLGVTSIYVTHDQEEALSLSDHVVIMKAGRVQQQCDPLTAYFRPANAFVADFMGASNILPVQRHPAAQGAGVAQLFAQNDIEIHCDPAAGVPEPAAVAIKSVHLRLSAERPAVGDNVWEVTVQRQTFVGDAVEYELDWQGITLRARELSTSVFAAGQRAFCNVSRQHAYPLSSMEIDEK